MANKIKVIVADDHAILRDGLVNYIEKKSDSIEVVGQASDWKELMSLLRSDISCDLALLDIKMPGGDGLSIVEDIKVELPDIKILMMSSFPEEEYALRFINAGASGFISKVESIRNVIESIHDVLMGRLVLSEDLRERLTLERINKVNAFSNVEGLSNREFQVMVQLGSGQSISEVAELLHLSPRTVHTHRNNILRKMSWRNNAELMFFVIKKGLVDK
ncbi:MAG: response regulator transcription factor [Nitrospinota bacterium]